MPHKYNNSQKKQQHYLKLTPQKFPINDFYNKCYNYFHLETNELKLQSRNDNHLNSSGIPARPSIFVAILSL